MALLCEQESNRIVDVFFAQQNPMLIGIISTKPSTM